MIDIINKKIFRFYREQLNSKQKLIYDDMLMGFLSYSDSIVVSTIKIDQIIDIFNKIRLDNPILFFIELISYEFSNSSRYIKIIPKYRFSLNEINNIIKTISITYKSFINSLSAKCDLDKELAIHDFLCKNVTYDFKFAKSSYECVGPLLFKKGVCEGISKAAKLLLDLLDVNSLVVIGRAKQDMSLSYSQDNHAWNIVKVENEYYHLDITFDLSNENINFIKYGYFNLSTKSISFDHETTQFGLPNCVVENDYYEINNLYFKTKNQFIDYLKFSVKARKENITFKTPRICDINTIKEQIIDITKSQIAYSFISAQFSVLSNEAQFVFYINFQYY